jgi:hypothetical protein
MTYFQNPFSSEFRGSWVLGDRQYSLTFSCPANTGRSDSLVSAWKKPINSAYDLSGNDSDGNLKKILSIRLTADGGSVWSNIEIDTTDNTNASLDPVPTDSAMRPHQIVAILNANPSFSSYFSANLEKFDSFSNNERIVIKQKFSNTRMRFFVINKGAEEALGFNLMAGVAELPSYFKKYKIYGGDMSYPMDGTNAIVELSPSNSGGSSNIDNNIIDDAVDYRGVSFNLDSSSIKEDYELLEGRASGLYTFQKITVDESDRITQIIEYPAGASVGDLARKIIYSYSGSNTNPDSVLEIPYVVQSGDLLSP